MQTADTNQSGTDLDVTAEDTDQLPNDAPLEKVLPKKLLRLPLARIKHIIKLDPDNGKMNKDSVFLIAKSTELFLEYLGKESAKYALQSKRKTVQKRDINAVIDSIPQLCFLEGALE